MGEATSSPFGIKKNKTKGIVISSLGKQNMRSFLKKVSLPVRQMKGSLTVEAALVVPLFLFACICLLSLMDMMRLFMQTEMKLYSGARDLAVYTGASGSEGEDWIRLKLVYPATAKGGHLFTHTLLLENHVNVHVFNGYGGDPIRERSEDEIYVYVTEGSEVYHRSRDCRHLHVSITQISGSARRGARNEDGARYHDCPYCTRGYSKEELSSATMYITDYGNKCHMRINCPALKRTVYVVPLSQTGGKRPCRDCG